jgi:hypothetical protein
MMVDESKLRWCGIDMQPRCRRRLAVIGSYFGFAALVGGMPHWVGLIPELARSAAVILLIGLGLFVSVFLLNGVVKSFEEATEEPALYQLNSAARKRYGVASFDAANEEQKEWLLQRYRVGRLDERERGERDSAARWAWRWIAFLLVIVASQYLLPSNFHKTVGQPQVAAILFGFWVMAITLPQARVLWTEADPREMDGEMELIGKEV